MIRVNSVTKIGMVTKFHWETNFGTLRLCSRLNIARTTPNDATEAQARIIA